MNLNWLKSLLLGIGVGVIGMLAVSVLAPTKGSNQQSARVGQNHANRSASASLGGNNTRTSILRTSVEGLPASYVQLCQGLSTSDSFTYPVVSAAAPAVCSDSGDWMLRNEPPSKYARGIDQNTPHRLREPRWRNGGGVPWEQFAFGEYIGPHRTPHVAEYRIRVGDQLEFNFLQTRQRLPQKYQLKIGDQIQVSSAIDPSLTQPANNSNSVTGLQIMPDGSVSLALIGEVQAAGKTVEDLQRELNDKYTKFVKNPSMVVNVTKSDTPLADLLEAVDSRFGTGGRSRQVTVSPDGTVQLPLIGSVPAVGLTLAEIGREINSRYRERIQGIEVTPILQRRAPTFIYVVGEVRNPGRFELTSATTAMQAIALAGGYNRVPANLRQIVVFRRDQNWQLVATKLDLSAGFYGKSPRPSDEIWLRDSDIVLVPPKPIQRLSDAVNLYLTTTLYAIFPQQGVAFNFDNFRTL